MSDLGLGKIIEGEALRDAIHVAVAPVTAAGTLYPGMHVGFVEPGSDKVGPNTTRLLGIVDPFLKHPVLADQRFWLFLYPNTVASIRHHWVHPEFGDTDAKATDDDVALSKRWLENYAARMNSYDVEDNGIDAAYNRLVEGLQSGELFARGTDLHGLHELDDADELREHAERVLGIKIDWGRFTFSCSC